VRDKTTREGEARERKRKKKPETHWKSRDIVFGQCLKKSIALHVIHVVITKVNYGDSVKREREHNKMGPSSII
jgi:hypothetical protein